MLILILNQSPKSDDARIAAAVKTALSERIMKNYAYVKDAEGLSLYSEIASSTNPRPISEFGCI
ncbi:hypothetical protein [uncultured Alistipes sp.]|uniref:hypothetical protein n=1 Tax=uncultured Alistipes sp. TaxID=538949 RepID=UPI0025828402|nr:hypothetical protein [uncultured Alistipes sp.]